MTIKSDRWIIEQAEAGMIDPFESGQVRHQDGSKVISYGTSSYGYDVRCGPQFKVFTNIHSATVDPKAFDANSFVDIEDDVIVIVAHPQRTVYCDCVVVVIAKLDEARRNK